MCLLWKIKRGTINKMTGLKTLKDMRPNSFLLEQFDNDSFVVDARMLKAEAIKWIKYYRKKYPCDEVLKNIPITKDGLEYNDKSKSNKEPYCPLCGCIHVESPNFFTKRWIKHFFNITEDDLK